MSCTRRAVSGEPTSDLLKRSGDIFGDGPLNVKRARLSDFRGLANSRLIQQRIFSNDSDNGGVIRGPQVLSAGVSPENADLNTQTSIDAQTSYVVTASDTPALRLISSVEETLEPLSTDGNDGVRQNELATEKIPDAKTSSDIDASSPSNSSMCPTPAFGVEGIMESVEDSEGIWTSVTSSDSSEDRGVELGLDEEQGDNAPHKTCTLSTSPVAAKATAPSFENAFVTFMESIESACSVLQGEIHSGIDAKKRSDALIMGNLEDMLAEKDNIIHLLQKEIQHLRTELERCKQIVYQHGKETEEWASRMMELICRLPGHESIC